MLACKCSPQAEAAARREAGGLDPKRQERLARLKEILEKQVGGWWLVQLAVGG